MGEPYCNDSRCQRNRSGERHKAHVIGEEQASVYHGEIIAMTRDAHVTGKDRNMKLTLNQISQMK